MEDQLLQKIEKWKKQLSGESNPQNTEVWAQLSLSKESCINIRNYFIEEVGVKPEYIINNVHLTVYYARRPMPGVEPISEKAHVILPVLDTRLMVMAPGGENPKPDLEPSKRKVGIRVHRQSIARRSIYNYRKKLLKYETKHVLGKRKPSTNNRNAFGARYFQPHISLLKPGNGLEHDLTKVGIPLRENIDELIFDKFYIRIVQDD